MTEQSTKTEPKSPLENKSVSAAKILQQVVLIQVHTHIWSASQALKGQDLPRVSASDLPPAFLASLGSKKLIDIAEMKIFHTLKRRAQRCLESYGVDFMGGFAIPCTKIETVAQELNEIELEFNVAKDNFIQSYPTLVENWIKANPTWKHALTAKPVPVEKVALGISFDWLATHVTEPKGKHAKILSRGFHKQVDSLSDKLFSEISAESMEILEKSFLGKDRVSQSVIGRVKQIQEKLKNLCFLNSAATPLSELIAYVRSLLPPNGFIEGECFSVLFQTLELLRDTSNAMEFAAKVVAGKTVEEVASEYLLQTMSQQSNSLFVQSTLDVPVPSGSVSGIDPTVSAVASQKVLESILESATTVQTSADIESKANPTAMKQTAFFAAVPTAAGNETVPERKVSKFKSAVIF